MKAKEQIIGKKFNKLTVTGKVDTEKYQRSKYYCTCECGATKIVDGSKLRNGKTKSCGCIKKTVDYGKHRLELGIANQRALITSYRGNAKTKSIIFELTDDEMIGLFQLNCHYCGSEPKGVFQKKRT